ncbi:chaplin [Streptomyces sp. NPDC046712]|uniref:chaplin n=1 Tax=Streptomyces sp. NPDC046712 TaxID=3154802 RepID=UPI0033C33EEA
MKCKKAAVVVAGLFMALGAAAPAMADSDAYGFAAGSPGVLSGNNIQVPINIPINFCGNSLNLIGAINPAFGNVCVNY